MTNFLYTLRLALIKFKRKGWRNAFAIFSLALGSVLILTILIGLAGLLPFAQKALKDPLYGRYIARYGNSSFFGPITPNQATTDSKVTTLSDAQKDLEGYKYKKIITNSNFNFPVGFTGSVLPAQKIYQGGFSPMNQNSKFVQIPSSGLYPVVRDSSFTQDAVETGYSMDKKGDSIPVLASASGLLEMDDSYVNSIPNVNDLLKNQDQKLQTLRQKYLGKEFELTVEKNGQLSEDLKGKYSNGELNSSQIQEYQDKLNQNQLNLGKKVKIVGFVNYLSGVFETNVLVFPQWAEQDLKDLVVDKTKNVPNFNSSLGGYGSNQVYSSTKPVVTSDNSTAKKELSSTDYLIEFNSKEDRAKFLKDKYGQAGDSFFGDYNPYNLDSSLVSFESFIDTAKNVGLGIGVFILIIGCLFSISLISKEISDSQKEIGLYRSLGATKTNVSQIYFAYSFILSSVSFVVALILAFGINALISVFVNDYIYFGISSTAFNIFVIKPNFILIGFPVLEILAYFILLVGISLIFALLPIRRIAKIDPIKVLKE